MSSGPASSPTAVNATAQDGHQGGYPTKGHGRNVQATAGPDGGQAGHRKQRALPGQRQE